MQENNVIRLSDAVSKLLSETNKDKTIGEVSEELSDYIVEIKELVDSGSITYEDLKKEISKNLKTDSKILPGSVSQLLIGCVNEQGSCPLRQEEPENVPFVYDTVSDKIVPLSKIDTPVTDNTYAVLYITGNPDKINIDSLGELEKKGFRKLIIEYKNISSTEYKKINIENLRKYIYSRPGENKFEGMMMLGVLIILVLISYGFLFSNKQ